MTLKLTMSLGMLECRSPRQAAGFSLALRFQWIDYTHKGVFTLSLGFSVGLGGNQREN